ncbi:predicted protein [Naegleria gruberi]|uniref:Predicted protein n=1 Tax=Naegleria gruberi TaxID=5762 RepID=D2VZF3_NAEGR|nr:uncharacterized protein NAEGRDRAFT_74469 [Naegleria gruberi]EFC37782.1 predicted protein [Naegleria gruberi]|eukprot:XP_002670526.1 predicted protein [Naegleria gruberi strain NEG-M]
MDFFRSLKKRKINPASPQQPTTTTDNTSEEPSQQHEPTGGFFYNLFFGNSSNNNYSKPTNKKRVNHDEEEQYESDDDYEEQENQGNSRVLHRSTQPKKRIHSKYPEIKKHRDEIQKMKNSIQSLTDKHVEGVSAAHVNMSMLTNTALTPRKISDESEEHSKGYPKTPNTPASARKKKSLLSSIFSFSSAANSDSPPPLPSTPSSATTPQVSNSMINVKITELKQDDLQRIKNSYRSPLYTRTPPRREMQNHATTLDETLAKRKSVGYGNQQIVSQINNQTSEMPPAGCRNSFDCESSVSVQTRKSQGGQFQTNLAREASSSSGFSNFSDSSNSFNTMSSISQTPQVPSFQYLTQPTRPFVFNLNLLKGQSIKNSGNGFKENSNVYAVIEVGNYRKTSRVVMNSSNPVWNQQFQFILPTFYHPFVQDLKEMHDANTEPINNVVTIRLYDHDEIFEHEFLGKVEFKLDELFVQCCQDSGKVHEKTGQLIMKRSKTFKQMMNLFGVETGQLEIQFRVEYHPRKEEVSSHVSNGVASSSANKSNVVYCFF